MIKNYIIKNGEMVDRLKTYAERGEIKIIKDDTETTPSEAYEVDGCRIRINRECALGILVQIEARTKRKVEGVKEILEEMLGGKLSGLGKK